MYSITLSVPLGDNFSQTELLLCLPDLFLASYVIAYLCYLSYLVRIAQDVDVSRFVDDVTRAAVIVLVIVIGVQ